MSATIFGLKILYKFATFRMLCLCAHPYGLGLGRDGLEVIWVCHAPVMAEVEETRVKDHHRKEGPGAGRRVKKST